MNNIETMKLALEALESITWVNSFNEGDYLTCNFKSVKSSITSLRQAIEQAEQYNATSDRVLMENAQGDLERVKLVQTGVGIGEPEFTTHAVENAYDWSEWVCPDPKGYLMKCCDCGLVHEADFKVVRYKSETEREDCEPVDDPNVQAVFRMRRSEQWSPVDTAHRAGGLPMEQAEQAKPVAWIHTATSQAFTSEPPPSLKAQCRPLVFGDTAPPRQLWVGLTDEEIWKFWWARPEVPDGEDDSMEAEFVAAVRRVLAAHGMKGEG